MPVVIQQKKKDLLLSYYYFLFLEISPRCFWDIVFMTMGHSLTEYILPPTSKGRRQCYMSAAWDHKCLMAVHYHVIADS